jgi:hypothetical protein
LKVLLDDLIAEDGTFKKNPDPQSEAGVAMAKIKSVYGKVDTMEEVRTRL